MSLREVYFTKIAGCYQGNMIRDFKYRETGLGYTQIKGWILWNWHVTLLTSYEGSGTNSRKLPFQVSEKDVVEIFCEVQMDVFDKAVSEVFTKLAFEAVEKIINVSFPKD